MVTPLVRVCLTFAIGMASVIGYFVASLYDVPLWQTWPLLVVTVWSEATLVRGGWL